MKETLDPFDAVRTNPDAAEWYSEVTCLHSEASWICFTVRVWNAEAGASQGGNDLSMTRINADFIRSAE